MKKDEKEGPREGEHERAGIRQPVKDEQSRGREKELDEEREEEGRRKALVVTDAYRRRRSPVAAINR